jgi:hypothetical protein
MMATSSWRWLAAATIQLFNSATDTDARVVGVDAVWVECAIAAGFAIKSHFDVDSFLRETLVDPLRVTVTGSREWAALRDTEIRLAVGLRRCDSPRDAVRAAVFAELERSYIAVHAPEVSAIRDALERGPSMDEPGASIVEPDDPSGQRP